MSYLPPTIRNNLSEPQKHLVGPTPISSDTVAIILDFVFIFPLFAYIWFFHIYLYPQTIYYFILHVFESYVSCILWLAFWSTFCLWGSSILQQVAVAYILFSLLCSMSLHKYKYTSSSVVLLWTSGLWL